MFSVNLLTALKIQFSTGFAKYLLVHWFWRWISKHFGDDFELKWQSSGCCEKKMDLVRGFTKKVTTQHVPKKLFFFGAQNNRCEHFSTCVTNHSTMKIFSTDMQKPWWKLLCFFWPYLETVFHIKKSIHFPSEKWTDYKVELCGMTKIGFSRNWRLLFPFKFQLESTYFVYGTVPSILQVPTVDEN